MTNKQSTQPKKRQRLPAAKRKEQIIKAAQKVFVRLGMNGTRTRDLAEEAGVNEATLFLYFKNKQAIFDAAIVEPLSALIQSISEKADAFAETSDPNSKDRIGIAAHEEIFASMEDLAPLMATALFSNEQLGAEIYSRDIAPMVKKLSKAAKVSFDVDDAEAADFIVTAALGLNFIFVMQHKFTRTKPNAAAIAQKISNLFVHGGFGITTPPNED